MSHFRCVMELCSEALLYCSEYSTALGFKELFKISQPGFVIGNTSQRDVLCMPHKNLVMGLEGVC